MTVAKAKKKVAASKIKKPELISASLRAISKQYKDTVAPGLVLSYLPSGEFYASLRRYQGSANNSQVVYNAKAISWESAVKQIMTKMLEEPQVMETLRKALK